MSDFDTAAARARCITALEDGDPCEATWAGHELAALYRIDELERQRDEARAHHDDTEWVDGINFCTECEHVYPCPTVQALTDTEEK